MTESQIDCVIPQLQMNPVFGWLPCNSVRGWHSLRLMVNLLPRMHKRGKEWRAKGGREAKRFHGR